MILCNKTNFAGAFIDEGKLAIGGNNNYYILGDSNLELILKILSFKISKICIMATNYKQYLLDSESIAFIPDLSKLNINLSINFLL